MSRQAVYLHFGTRAGLLMAMVDYKDDSSTQLPAMRKANGRAKR